MTTMYKRSLFRRRHESMYRFYARKAWELAKDVGAWLLFFGMIMAIEYMILVSI